MKKAIIICILIGIGSKAFSQIENTTKKGQDSTPIGEAPPDVLNTQFIYSPGSDDFDFANWHAELNFPVQLKIGKGMLMQGLMVDVTSLDYNKSYAVDLSNLDRFYNLAYTFVYDHPLKNNWGLLGLFTPNISSNLAGKLTSEDVSLDGFVMAAKYWGNAEKGSALSFGAGTIRLNGKKMVIPAVAYYRIVNPKFSYSIGFPETFIDYKFNEKSAIKAALLPVGFDANLSQDTPIMINGVEAKRAQYTSISFNVGYSHTLGGAWKFRANIGYSLTNDYTLVDDNGDELYDFEPETRPEFTIGIAYDLIGQLMKKEKNKKQ